MTMMKRIFATAFATLLVAGGCSSAEEDAEHDECVQMVERTELCVLRASDDYEHVEARVCWLLPSQQAVENGIDDSETLAFRTWAHVLDDECELFAYEHIDFCGHADDEVVFVDAATDACWRDYFAPGALLELPCDGPIDSPDYRLDLARELECST
jgi:hypothetical protein